MSVVLLESLIIQMFLSDSGPDVANLQKYSGFLFLFSSPHSIMSLR